MAQRPDPIPATQAVKCTNIEPMSHPLTGRLACAARRRLLTQADFRDRVGSGALRRTCIGSAGAASTVLKPPAASRGGGHPDALPEPVAW